MPAPNNSLFFTFSKYLNKEPIFIKLFICIYHHRTILPGSENTIHLLILCWFDSLYVYSNSYHDRGNSHMPRHLHTRDLYFLWQESKSQQ